MASIADREGAIVGRLRGLARAGARVATAFALAVLAVVFVAPHVALAAPTMNVSIEPVHYTTGAPITTAAFGQNGDRVAYRVNYSCLGEPCTDVTVAMAPSQPDPYGLADDATLAVGETLLVYESWTPPPGGGTVTGDDATGKVFHLGDLPAGASGSFLVVYAIPASGTYSTARPSQFYPSGFQIQNSATIAAANGTAPVTRDASVVTWSNQVPNPGIVKTNPGTVRPGTNVSYTVRMASGAFPRRDSQAITGTSQWVAAGDFVVVDHLPPQATYVSSSGGGVYDAATHTITWTNGTLAAPSYTAAGGWGSTECCQWASRSPYGPRTVTVSYPASAFPEADASGCNFEVNVTNSVDVTLHYLDTARTEKSAAASSTHPVACYSPFGRAALAKGVLRDTTSGGVDALYVPPDVTGMTCPASGTDQWGRACTPGNALAPFGDNLKYWQVTAYNAGNVPGRATIVDNTLDQPGMPVYQIRANASTPAPTIDWTYQCGSSAPVSGTTTGTSVALSAAQQSAGCRYTAATVASGDIAPGNIRPTDTGRGTGWAAFFDVRVTTSSPVNVTNTNTASATMAYPAYPEIAAIPVGPTSAQARLIPRPLAAAGQPTFSAGFPTAAVVSGGGNAVPGRNVTFSVNGTTANIPADVDITPQYVFVAPVGWTIVNGSAAFTAGAVPPGVTFTYATKTINGQTRDVVAATWPNTTVFGENVAWPTMTVVAQPTFAVAAGTTSTASAWISDSRNTYDNVSGRYNGPAQDAPDVDGDGNASEWFATAAQNVLVSSADGLSVTKEICRPNPEAADGCDWFSDPNALVPVSTTASNITYRVTVQNTGNTTLGSVVAYDVLPYIGDTGTSEGTAATPRGSTFAETVATTSDLSANVTLAFSDSTNPCRPEVYPAAPGCLDNWGALLPGSRSIRATVSGTLAPGATASFTYGAAVAAGAGADAKACNSVAIDSAQTLPSEPLPVCATTQEADLSITVPDRLPLQTGRPGVVPFTVTNHGGSAQAPAEATVSIPAGITVLSLQPDGWSCTPNPLGTAPIAGPATLTCVPVTPTGGPRPLTVGLPDALDVPAMPTSGTAVCVPAAVVGQFHDPLLENNTTQSCLTIAPPPPTALDVEKDDGRVLVAPGDEYSYTLTVTANLTSETVTGATLTDELPDNLVFVSSAPPTVPTGQNPDGSGGTVTWSLADFAPLGTPNSSGSGTTGGANTPQTVTLRVRVVDGASGTVDNAATVTAPDPSIPSATLTDTDADSDQVQSASLTLAKAATPTVVATVGQQITYTFTATNDGNVPLTGVQVADPMADLSPISCTPAQPFVLAVDQTVSCTATYAAKASDFVTGRIDNSATASGQPTIGPRIDSDPATATVVATANPSMTLDKRATETSYAAAGDVLHFSFVITNTGNVPLNDVVVADQLPGTAAVVCPTGPLAPQATITCTTTYTVTAGDVDAGSVTNRATATAVSPGGAPVTTPEDDVTVPANRTPSITIDKTATETLFSAAGTTLHYRFVVTNTGNVTLTGVTVTDPLPNLSAIDCPATTLLANTSQTCTATYVTTAADVNVGLVTNTASVTGTAPAGTTPSAVSATDTHTVPAQQSPAIAIVKTVTPNEVLNADEELTYTFEVTNTGNVTLTEVGVIDPLPGLSAVACGTTVLDAGDSTTCTATYRVTQQIIDTEDQLLNEAKAVGTPPLDPPIESAPDSAAIPPVLAPGLTIDKIGPADPFTAAGETLTFRFAVANTGNMTLFDLVVNDPLPGLGAITCDTETLAPLQETECRAAYTTTQADVDNGGVTNTATASAHTARDRPVASAQDEVFVPATQTTGATFAKGAEETSYDAAGQTITYTFEITNTGNVTLSDLTVTDHLDGVSSVACPETVLAPATSPPAAGVMVCTATYTVTQVDVDTGTIHNAADLDATSPTGPLATLTDEHDLTAIKHPELTLDKRALTASFDGPDQTLEYELEVTNTGNVTITEIAVDDPLVGGALTCPAVTDLAPGESLLCTAAYTTDQADVDDGGVTNTATVTGTDPDDTPVTAAGSVTVPADQHPAVTLVKTVEETTYTVGTTLHYRFAVANTGNVTITALTVDDPMPGLSEITCPTATLAPGATTACTATYIVTPADVGAGRITNTATVSGGGTDIGPIVSSPSTAEVSAAVIPPPPPPSTTPTPADPGELPATGADNLGRSVAIATALLGAGLLGLAIVGRRRRPA